MFPAPHRVVSAFFLSLAVLCPLALSSPCMPTATALAASETRKRVPPVRPLWVYHQMNYDILAARLSPDNSRLVFVRQWHLPTGHEAEYFTAEELDRLWAPLAEDSRYADPEIMLMDVPLGANALKRTILGHAGGLGAGKALRVDYGWSPVFSADGRKILYAHQTRPAKGRYTVAATLNGNEIREYDLAGKATATLARPAFGYLSTPTYDAGGRPLFFLADAANGDWGGHVGVGTPGPDGADGPDGGVTELFPARKSHGLYHIVVDFVVSNGRLLVLQRRPLTSGTYIAERYAAELVDAADGTVVHGWEQDGARRRYRSELRQCPQGPQVYDRGWTDIGAAPKGLPAEEDGMDISSPDCAATASFQDGTLAVRFAGEKQARLWETREAEIASLVWSEDSSLLVLVLTGNGRGYDEIVVLRARDLPAR